MKEAIIKIVEEGARVKTAFFKENADRIIEVVHLLTQAFRDGKKVLLFAFATETAQSMPGRFLPVFWSPVWFPTQTTMGILCDPRHPALARFPTEFHSNWQWWNLLEHSRSVVLDDTPASYRPTTSDRCDSVNLVRLWRSDGTGRWDTRSRP